MAKAHITTKDGAVISIEGTTDEVSQLLARFNSALPVTPQSRTDSRRAVSTRTTAKTQTKFSGRKKTTATTLVAEMIDNGFFKEPQALADIQAALKQGGHYFSQPGVATALLRAVKARKLRRIKEDNGWTYVA